MEFGDVRLPERFWAKCEQRDSCWIWTACLQPNGYGKFGYHGRTWLTHRLAFERLTGEVHTDPLDHLCRNRACANPAHLERVTTAINNQRANRTRLTDADVLTIRTSSLPQSVLARTYGIHPSHVSKILSGTKWRESA